MIRGEHEFFAIQPWPESHPLVCDCPACGANDMLQAVAWEQNEGSSWHARLFCGACHTFFEGDFPTDEVCELEDALTLNDLCLHDQLLALEQANMTDYVERFTRALHAGGVYPEDF